MIMATNQKSKSAQTYGLTIRQKKQQDTIRPYSPIPGSEELPVTIGKDLKFTKDRQGRL